MFLHDPIISLRMAVWAHKASLIPPHYFYCSECTKPWKWAVMYLCVRYIYILIMILPQFFNWIFELFRRYCIFRFSYYFFCYNITAVLMKRKFEQWWATILPISTKRTVTFHLNSLVIKICHEIWRWKLRPWLGTGISIWWGETG